MRKVIILFFIMLMASRYAFAADPKLEYSGETVNAVKIDADKWSFSTKDGEYVMVKASYVNEMNDRLKLLLAKAEFDQKIIAAKDAIIKKVDEFEKRSDEHIAAQKDVIETADKLYTGYKDLYHDLKSIAGFTEFSIVPAVGFLYFSENSPAPYGALGLGYRNVYAQFSYGRKYGTKYDRDFNTSFGGFQVGWRIPVF